MALWIIAVVILASLMNLKDSCFANPWENQNQNQNQNHIALFVFGDSLYDPGNNNYINTIPDFRANFTPYGHSFFILPTGRFSDGRLISDFIAEFADLPQIPAYLQPGDHDFGYGANFASAGAGVLSDTYPGLVVDLRTQLQYFKDVKTQLLNKLGHNEAQHLLSNAVYLLCCGGNDYFSLSRTNDSHIQQQYVHMVIGNLTQVIKELHDLGGRKFGFFSMPPLGHVPSVRAQSPGYEYVEELATLTELHNKAFKKELEKLEMELTEFLYSKFDLFTSIMQRLENPTKYGFMAADRACCGSGPLRGMNSCGGKRGIEEYEQCENASEYMFFDSSHPSEAANKQFAELFWHGSPDLTSPYNLKSFFQGAGRSWSSPVLRNEEL